MADDREVQNHRTTEREKSFDNSLKDLKQYLSTPENPVTAQEMSQFWTSLTDEEKREFKKTPLPKSEE